MKPANTARVHKCTLETSVNVCTMVRNRRRCDLVLLAMYLLGSVLASVVRITLGVDLAQFCFHCYPNYEMCAHKLMTKHRISETPLLIDFP